MNVFDKKWTKGVIEIKLIEGLVREECDQTVVMDLI
jgi:hypothetical protein